MRPAYRSARFLALFLAFYWNIGAMLPAMLRPAPVRSPVVCHGNHLECGCPPERVAARACCCYQKFSSCCIKNKNSVAGNSEAARRSEKRRGEASIAIAPCGGGYGFLGASMEGVFFIPSQDSMLPILEYSWAGHSLQDVPPPSVSPEPPVPPPRISA